MRFIARAYFVMRMYILRPQVTALVSYFAGVADTRNAVEALSRLTMNDAALKMDGVLGRRLMPCSWKLHI